MFLVAYLTTMPISRLHSANDRMLMNMNQLAEWDLARGTEVM
jgi:hypothetical protein